MVHPSARENDGVDVDDGVDGGKSHLTHLTRRVHCVGGGERHVTKRSKLANCHLVNKDKKGRRIEFGEQDASTMKREVTMRIVDNGVDGGDSHLTHGT
eukprot:12416210-Ditylum_brightwellii.AAC.1